MSSNFQKVMSGRRISIPEILTKEYGIKEGDIVIVENTSKGILIVPAEVVPRSS